MEMGMEMEMGAGMGMGDGHGHGKGDWKEMEMAMVDDGDGNGDGSHLRFDSYLNSIGNLRIMNGRFESVFEQLPNRMDEDTAALHVLFSERC